MFDEKWFNVTSESFSYHFMLRGYYLYWSLHQKDDRSMLLSVQLSFRSKPNNDVKRALVVIMTDLTKLNLKDLTIIIYDIKIVYQSKKNRSDNKISINL